MFDKLLGRGKKNNKAKGKSNKGKPTNKNGKPPRGKGDDLPPENPRAGGPPPSAYQPPLEMPAPGLSLDRKLDILGFVLFFVGLISLISQFNAKQSLLLEAIVNIFRGLAGVGSYGLPIGLMVIGAWIIVRKFGDKLPKFELERLVGIIMLYIGLLTTLHFFYTPTEAEIFAIARQGDGGGAIGAFFLNILFNAFGQIGALIFLGAWWIISVVFTLGLSVPEIVTMLSNWLSKYRLRIKINNPSATRPEPDRARLNLPFDKEESKRGGDVPKPARSAPTVSAAKAGPAPAPAAANVNASPVVPPATGTFENPIVIGADQVWELPEVSDMLDQGTESSADDEFDRKRVQIIESTLASFGAPVKIVEINRGPTITQFGVEPDFIEQRGGKKTKVKVGKIASLADDLALALSARSIRIEAPVPGKGYVGIEVPNEQTALVALRDVMESESFERLSKKGTLALGLGQDVSGSPISADLGAMPHMLIAGTTGSGKSVCVNAIIACLLIQNTPDDLKIMMVDPKRVELTGYNGIPHLLGTVVVEMERVVASLQWVTREMDERYRKFAKLGVRNIADYNARMATAGDKKMPFLVIIIDELADLMMLAPDETERTITRLAQLARATGIHLIIATQRPSVDVVTGLIKANFPARIAFAVASSVDSRVILDQPGAETLLGRGDMLFQSPDASAPLRMQGVYVSDAELHRLVRYWKGARGFEPSATVAPEAGAATPTPTSTLATVINTPQSGGASVPLKQSPIWDPTQFGGVPSSPETKPDGEDELYDEAVKSVRQMKKASITLLQRQLRIGYTRAARLIDLLEERGIIGPAESGAKPREVINYGGNGGKPTVERETVEE